jgi:hypothetical protein
MLAFSGFVVLACFCEASPGPRECHEHVSAS